MKKIITLLLLTFSLTVFAQTKSYEIYDIQGSGMTSPLVGQNVTTLNNVVTLVLSNSFYMQTPDSRDDNNPETSNGIVVYTSNTPTVQVGDMVNVTADVTEYYDLTELNNPSVTVVSSGNPLPTAVEWDENTPSPIRPQPENEIERYEGMIVEFYNGVATSGTNVHGDFYAVARSTRIFREPGIDYPGLNGLPVFDGNPEKFEIDTYSTDPVLVKGGNIIHHVKGVVRYSFGDYGIFPIELDVDTDLTPDAASDPEDNPNLYSVGTLNCHVFNSDDASLYQIRLKKFSKYIRDVMKAPDVIALQEVKDINILNDLAGQIHQDNSNLSYTAYLIYSQYAFDINVGYLVNSRVNVSQVQTVGANATFDFDGTKYTFDRPPLVMNATVANGSFPVTFIDLHLRSRNGIDDPNDGNFVRAKREAQAVWLSQYLQALQENDPDINFVVLGDYNSFEFTDGYFDVLGQITGDLDPLPALDPATDIVNPDLINLTKQDDQNNRYSFVYNGDAQALDHMVVSSGFMNYIRYFKFVHANSDYPEAFATDDSTPIATSDHDGAVLRFTTYPVSVDDNSEAVTMFKLSQNYPNPFSKGSGGNQTTIKYSVPAMENGRLALVTLSVYDVLGRKVATLVNEAKTSGNYSVKFDASKLSSGVYYYRLTSGKYSDVKKMILMK